MEPVKVPYLKCNRQNHGENLNYVCFDPNCENKGLICSLCRQDHLGHRILPFKYILVHLKNYRQRPLLDEEYSNHLERIENIKNTILYELRVSVQDLAIRFQKVEQDIIDKFSQIKVQLLEQIQLNMKFEAVIANALNKIQDEESYLDDFKRLADWVKYADEKQIIFEMQLEEVVDKFNQWKDILADKLKKVNKFVDEQLGNKLILPKTSSIVAQIPKKPQFPKIYYTFSHNLKGYSSFNDRTSIVLKDSNVTAIQSQTSNTRFVLIQNGIGLKQRSISFTFPKLTNWIGVGICIKSKIILSGYQFKYEKLGHGSYLLSNNGYTWSHSQAQDNIHSSSFLFKQGQILDIFLLEKELQFKVRDSESILKLKVDIKEHQWPEVCWCANICSIDDQIRIVQNQ